MEQKSCSQLFYIRRDSNEKLVYTIVIFTGLTFGSTSVFASSPKKADNKDNQCIAAGSRYPRDVDVMDGQNIVQFTGMLEHHAHGVRVLATSPALLCPIH